MVVSGYTRIGYYCVLMLVSLAWCGVVFGGGTAADYERAEGLHRLVSNKVFRARVEPNWFGDDGNFWYRVQTGADSYEYVVVEAVKGERRLAFDHDRIAGVLGAAGVEHVEANKLGIEKLEFDFAGNAVEFKLDDKIWRCELSDHSLQVKATVEEELLAGYLPGAGPMVSGLSEKVVTVTFVNLTDKAVELFWLNQGGERESFGKLDAGKRREKRTYSGHVWLVVDADAKAIVVYRAGDKNAKAVIGVDAGKRDDVRPKPLDVAQDRRGKGRRGGENGFRGASADGKWKAFVRDNNVWMRKIGGGKEVRLSSEGTADDGYVGRFYWSGDSKKLVVIRKKKAQEHKVYYVESSPSGQLQPKLQSINYLKAGDVVAIEKPHLFDVETLKEIAISDELFDNQYSIWGVRWEKDSSRFTFMYNQRGHQVFRIVGVDGASGKVSAVVDEKSETFICYSSKLFADYVEGTGEIVWMSERDGWNHLYLYGGKTGRVKNQITKGEWVVRDVDRVDAEKRQIWFRAGGVYPEQDPYYIHYCRVNFDGSGFAVLTEGDGTHKVEYSPGGEYFVDSYSRVDMPGVCELRRSEDGKLVCELERADWSKLLATGWQVPERFVAKGRDGVTDIYGIIIRPTNFDAGKKYPVIEDIYAGPHGSFVPKRFSSYHYMQKMAELGFIVVKIDGMGTSNRSKKFHDVCWKNLADSGLPDRIAWIKSAAAKYECMDIERVGIYGGSAGGQSAACAVMTHGDFYKVAVADCGCHDNRMDKIWWNEQWMGWPVDESYAANSNVTLAKGLTGKLFLIVGELDKNVDPASTMQVVDALVKADKDFDMLIVPGAGHGAGEGKYGSRRRADYFVRHLLEVEPRS